MKTKSKKKTKKQNRKREKELTVYSWLLKHACEKTAFTTPTQEWSAEI